MHICECWTDTWREFLKRKAPLRSPCEETQSWVSYLSVWTQTNKQTNKNKETAAQGVLSPVALTVLTLSVQRWTEAISSWPPAAAPVLSCHILFITCWTVTRSNADSFSGCRSYLRKERKVLFPVSYLAVFILFLGMRSHPVYRIQDYFPAP